MDLELKRERTLEIIKELGSLLDGGELSEYQGIAASLSLTGYHLELVYIDDAIYELNKIGRLNAEAIEINNKLEKAQTAYARALGKLTST